MSRLEVDVRLKRFAAVAQTQPVTALQDLRFEAAAGEFLCLFGPSGCGKTTLLNIVAGLDRDFEGRVTLPTAAGRRQPVIGYVFQTPRLLPWRTVEQNIALVAPDKTETVDDLLRATGLEEFRHAYPERLSVGMARRVALARAFAAKPDILLLDEPFVSLDEATAERLRSLLLEIWQARPTTVLFVTHDPREAVMLADRIVLLTPSPGRVATTMSIPAPRVARAMEPLVDELRRHVAGGNEKPGGRGSAARPPGP